MIIRANSVLRLAAMGVTRVSLDGDDSMQVVSIDTRKKVAEIYALDESGSPYIEDDDLVVLEQHFSVATLEFDGFKLVVE